MGIGKIESDFLNIKIEIRKLIDELTPEENENLNRNFKQIDDIINRAIIKKVKDDENREDV